MGKTELVFGDLHFHTNYSDNRDRASFKEMVEKGKSEGLHCFGTGDHNHNLTPKKWEHQKKETEQLKKLDPDLILFTNCEITFLLGHFLVISPSRITGTIEEGYRYLLGEYDRMIILNHPYLPSDTWKERYVPHATGIEVINGAVLSRKASQDFLRKIKRAIELPHVACYAEYLRRGHAVVPFGSSDAHGIEEIGCGVTGFYIQSEHANAVSGEHAVLNAVRNHQIFAATKPGMILEWEYHRENTTISWRVSGNALSSYTKERLQVEWYRGNHYLGIGKREGKWACTSGGLYWFALRTDDSYAVSSPVPVGNEQQWESSSRNTQSGRKTKQHKKADNEKPASQNPLLKDKSLYTIWKKRKKGEELILPAEGEKLPEDIIIYTTGNGVTLLDGEKKELKPDRKIYKKESVITKTDTKESFFEFFIWLERNEVHEYKFVWIDYHVDKNHLDFSAWLLPAVLLGDSSNLDKTINQKCAALHRVLSNISSITYHVQVVPRYRLLFPSSSPPYQKQTVRFPLTLYDASLEMTSTLYNVACSCYGTSRKEKNTFLIQLFS